MKECLLRVFSVQLQCPVCLEVHVLEVALPVHVQAGWSLLTYVEKCLKNSLHVKVYQDRLQVRRRRFLPPPLKPTPRPPTQPFLLFFLPAHLENKRRNRSAKHRLVVLNCLQAGARHALFYVVSETENVQLHCPPGIYYGWVGVVW